MMGGDNFTGVYSHDGSPRMGLGCGNVMHWPACCGGFAVGNCCTNADPAWGCFRPQALLRKGLLCGTQSPCPMGIHLVRRAFSYVYRVRVLAGSAVKLAELMRGPGVSCRPARCT